ncbi:Dihydropteroate synthase-like protein [Microdochium trichocladiopsis]|uniref:Folic acid synthesis protein FOL1 n=1 Tax=Microdochium trichocladiopsis TaxID=1682393 RepID=A0A9P8YEH5_9PEZI|nr:Dihydropteroate synthase-like protein [Microdochium trichocladiopsis]KAH7035487.1 Dihydropteroate synthase-like protein [Microdochium trichocladiopsis]
MEKSFATSPERQRCGCAEARDAKRTAYIALGSNMGDRVAMIEQACKEMGSRGITVKRTSGLWETEPMYVLDQDRFVNGACEVETELEPLSLLDELQDIENAMGRKKVIDKGPRNIDLDVLMYENEIVDHERLKIPHIGIAEREFVLRPLAQIAATKSIDATKPWKMIQDYLYDLPPAREPLSTLTPIGEGIQPLNALKSHRKTHVMAILNVTPDSFSDGGTHVPESLARTIIKFVKGGATMIDVGGQSTAPGRPQVSAEEEIKRIVPAIELIRSLPEAQGIAISIDTYRASVAEAAVKAGADIVNDVSAGLMDLEMLPMMAKLGKTVCLMHMRGDPATMSQLNDYPEGLIPTVAKELLERVAAAEAAGIRRWRIILDPGFGFAKVGEQNIELLRHFEELKNWPGLEGLPWLLGSSRKSFIGKITGVATPGDRIFGTAATVTAAVQVGADIVRVHDVVEMGQVVKMADAIWRY